MMRMTTLLFVCSSFVIGCSWGEGSGSDDPTPDAAGAGGGGVCGDGVCAANEVASCSADCGSGGGGGGGGGGAICGNNTCESGESPQTCPNDCTSGGGGSGSGSGSGSCPADPFTECLPCIIGLGACPAGLDATSCQACLLGGGGGLPTGMCNMDGVCDAAEMIDPTCADCP